MHTLKQERKNTNLFSMFALRVSSSTKACNRFTKAGSFRTASTPLWILHIFFRTSDATKYASSLFLKEEKKRNIRNDKGLNFNLKE